MQPKRSIVWLIVGAALIGWGAMPLVQPYIPANILQIVKKYLPKTDPSPFPDDKLCVLIVYSSEANNPENVLQIINSTKLRRFVMQHSGEFHLYDDEQQFSDDIPPYWQKIVKSEAQKGLPRLIVGNGQNGEGRAITESDTEDTVLSTVTSYAE